MLILSVMHFACIYIPHKEKSIKQLFFSCMTLDLVQSILASHQHFIFCFSLRNKFCRQFFISLVLSCFNLFTVSLYIYFLPMIYFDSIPWKSEMCYFQYHQNLQNGLTLTTNQSQNFRSQRMALWINHLNWNFI